MRFDTFEYSPLKDTCPSYGSEIKARAISGKACINSIVDANIHVSSDHQINYNWFNEPFAVFNIIIVYWDMHGLTFETSIWLLTGSIRLLSIIAHSANIKRKHTVWHKFSDYAVRLLIFNIERFELASLMSRVCSHYLRQCWSALLWTTIWRHHTFVPYDHV